LRLLESAVRDAVADGLAIRGEAREESGVALGSVLVEGRRQVAKAADILQIREDERSDSEFHAYSNSRFGPADSARNAPRRGAAAAQRSVTTITAPPLFAGCRSFSPRTRARLPRHPRGRRCTRDRSAGRSSWPREWRRARRRRS